MICFNCIVNIFPDFFDWKPEPFSRAPCSELGREPDYQRRQPGGDGQSCRVKLTAEPHQDGGELRTIIVSQILFTDGGQSWTIRFLSLKLGLQKK